MSPDPKGRLLTHIFYWDRGQAMGHGVPRPLCPSWHPLLQFLHVQGLHRSPLTHPSLSPALLPTLAQCRAGDRLVPAQPQGPQPLSPALPSPARLQGPPLCALPQAGVGVGMEGGMLWGDRNPCSGKHIKRVTLYRGQEGGAGRGPLLGALVRVAFTICLPFLLRLLVVRVEPLLLFPAHALHHHQHQDHHGQEAAHGGAHDHSHRRVSLGGLWGHRAGLRARRDRQGSVSKPCPVGAPSAGQH